MGSRPEYLNNYKFNWQALDIIATGLSSIDAESYIAKFTSKEEALDFLRGYGFDISNPIQNAEMFGNFQEAIQFIKRYFLKEGNPEDGLDYKIPNIFLSLTDVSELLLIAAGSTDTKVDAKESIWAGIILKVMHTILHLDKDVRHQYFTTIQTQIFDRFYKYLTREDGQLYLDSDENGERIPLVEFETKSKKSRESTIIKLLHKKENVAEELFDRIGIRFVTHKKIDCLRVLNFLNRHHIIMANNIKPSRSQNSLVDLNLFKKNYTNLVKEAIRTRQDEQWFVTKLEEFIDVSEEKPTHKHNTHTSTQYKAIHFTSRQLIKYKSPFYQKFNAIKKFVKKNELDSELAQKIMGLDTSSMANDIRFFYPYEVQITDKHSHEQNSRGLASHQEYKRSQLISAMNRVFKQLINYKD